jgi:hypothetical protein
MKKPLMSIGVKEISEEQYDHFFYKWLYTYGGTSDVKTLEQYIKEYDIDLYGDVDIYSTSVCPCVMCLEENIV